MKTMITSPDVALENNKATFVAKCKKTISKLIDANKVICHFTSETFVDPKIQQTLR